MCGQGKHVLNGRERYIRSNRKFIEQKMGEKKSEEKRGEVGGIVNVRWENNGKKKSKKVREIVRKRSTLG